MMKRREDHFLRVVAGALIGSDLSSRELIAFAERLRTDRLLGDRLARLMRQVAQISELDLGAGGSKTNSFGGTSAEEVIADVMRLFERKRMPKALALNILRASTGVTAWKPAPQATLRENVARLVELLSEEQRHSLVGRTAVALGVPEDPFLRELQ